MAFRRSFKRSFRRFSGGSFKVKNQLTRARRYASNNRKKASTMTTVALALGAFVAYEKFIKN